MPPRKNVRCLAAIAALIAAAGCTQPPEPGDPIAGLTAAQRDAFERGRAVFDSIFTPETGLGPLFNGTACVTCHNAPVTGGGGSMAELHATRLLESGSCDLLTGQGGPVFQLAVTPALRNALGIDAEPVPDGADRGRRTTPDVLGFGLLDAVPDSVLLARADPDDADGDGISGRVGRDFRGRIARFGRKALIATLAEFNQGAFPIEQGVTVPSLLDEGTVGGLPIPDGVDPVPEPELDAESVRLANDFVRLLAPPAPRKLSSEGRRGRSLFSDVGCTTCHLPSLRTGASDVAALADRDVFAYTDLLLHDMGPELADICFGPVAARAEFRTEPLMGLRLAVRFLHDGRAPTIEEAITAHGGEATASRDAFQRLSPTDRQALLAFLRSL